MRKQFDLIVIGAGPAASTVAHECSAAGWDVGIIDSRPFGAPAPCPDVIPTRSSWGAAEIVDWVQRMSGRGVRAESARIEWAELMPFKS